MFCHHCGAKVSEDWKSCPACGKTLHATTQGAGADQVNDRRDPAAVRETDRKSLDTIDMAKTVSADTLHIGKMLAGRYRIDKRLGSGGMGVVWKAADTELGDLPVAIKVVPPILAHHQRSIENLRREAMIALRLAHPSICRLYNFHSEGALKFLVMEFVEGKTLEQYLDERSDNKMSWDQVKVLVQQISAALYYAHSLTPPVLHMDIKPANIMIGADGRARLLDFGIAREIRDSVTRLSRQKERDDTSGGTIPYMAPEQFRGDRHIDERSDIYSFCCVVYECLAGHPLVNARGNMGWQVLNRPFEPLPDVPDEANRLLAAGLNKDPEQRPRSAKELWHLAKSTAGASADASSAIPIDEAQKSPTTAQAPSPQTTDRLATGKPATAPQPRSGTTPPRTKAGGTTRRRRQNLTNQWYGSYQPVEELYYTSARSVCSARRSDQAAPQFAAVIYHYGAGDMDAATAKVNLQNFMESARTQQQLTEAGARFWAPIYESGTDSGAVIVADDSDVGAEQIRDRVAFYITDLYPYCAAQLINQGRHLSAASLHAIVTSIVHGLEELKHTAHRAHGDVRNPANVLMRSPNPTGRGDVALTAPLPASQLDPHNAHLDDLMGLGELIYHLVTHQPLPSEITQSITRTVPLTEPWRRLGRRAQGWVELVTALLNPTADLTLAEILRQLKSLHSRPVFTFKRIAVAAAFVLVGGGVTLLLAPGLDSKIPQPVRPQVVAGLDWARTMLGLKKRPEVLPEKEWDELITAFEGWFGTLYRMRYKPEWRQLASDDHLKASIVTPLNTAEASQRSPHPEQIAGAVDKPFAALRADGPPAGKNKWIVDSLDLVHAVEKAVKRENWPLLQQLARMQVEFEQRGWKAPADMIRQRIDEVNPDERLFYSLLSVLDLASDLKQFDSYWQALQQKKQAMAVFAADPLLGRFEQFVEARLRERSEQAKGSPLGEMIDQLADDGPVMTLADQLASFATDVWPLLDPQLRLSGADDAQSIDAASLSPSHFTDRMNDLQMLLKMNPADDPIVEAVGQWEQSFESLSDIVASVMKESDSSDAVTFDASAELNRRLEALQRTLADIRRVEKSDHDDAAAVMAELDQPLKDLNDHLSALKQLSPIRRDLPARKELASKVPPLIQSVRGKLITLIPSAEGWLNQITQRQRIGTSAVIDQAWVAQRDRLLDGVTAAQLLNDVSRYDRLRAQITALEALLKRLDGDFSAEVAIAPDPPWHASLIDVIGARRERMIGDVLGELSIDAQLDRATDAVAQAWARRSVDFKYERDNFERLAKDFDRVEHLLDRAYQLKDSPLSGDGRTIDRLVGDWRPHRLFDDPQVRAALAPVLGRVEELERMIEKWDRAVLTDLTLNAPLQRPEQIWAAWQRLDEPEPAWPSTLAELDQELAMRKRIDAMIDQLDVEAKRRTALRDELAAKGHRRWAACFRQLRTAEAIEKAIEQRRQFYVDDAKLPDRSRFNLLLYELRREVSRQSAVPGQKVPEEQAASLIGRVQQQLEPLVASVPQARTLVDQLQRLRVRQAGQEGPASGSAKVRMSSQVSGGGAGIRFTWQSRSGESHELKFLRLADIEGGKSYLCTTEVSVGLFADVISAADAWGDIQGMVSPKPSEADGRRGPRSWQWHPSGRIEPAQEWLLPVAGLSPGALYPKDKGFPPPPPGRDTPIQYISPHAAMYFARLLGCRLPTADEWKAAFNNRYLSHANRRGGWWKKQKEHIDFVRSQNRNIKSVPYPDEDIFIRPPGLGGGIGAQAAPTGADAQYITEDDSDGALWFHPVKPANAPDDDFHHLVGNVSEYLFAYPQRFLESQDWTHDGLTALLKGQRQEDTLFIIGGSALSPAQIDVSTAYPKAGMTLAGGFSDVGFRLAFTAEVKPLIDELVRTINEQQYVVGSL